MRKPGKIELYISERLQKIENKYVQIVEDILILNLTNEILKLILKLRGETTLRVMERWKDKKLVSYSYYWLDSENKLIMGWDNAPHHKKLPNYPHHKHLGATQEIVDSKERCLEDVMGILKTKIPGMK